MDINPNGEINGLLLDETLEGFPEDWGNWTVTPQENDGSTFKESNVKWLWQTLPEGESRTVKYDVTVPKSASPGTYTLQGVIKSSDPEFEYTVVGDSNVEVVELYPLTIDTSGAGSGTVDKSPDKDYYDPNEDVTLTAQPAPNSTFSEWSGDLSGTDRQKVLTMDSYKSVTATFEIKQYDVDITPSPTEGGSVTGAGTYEHGTSVTVEATPNTGWKFVNWTEGGNVVSTSSSYTVENLTEDQNLTAKFELKTYTISASAKANGTIEPSGDVSVDFGNNKSFTIDPNTGYKVADVTVDGSSVYSELTFSDDVAKYEFTNVTENHSITATFEIKQYDVDITPSPTEGGSVTGGGTYEHGTSVTVEATPNTGWKFVNWTEGGNVVSTSSSYTIESLTEDRNLTANFEKKTYAVDVSANPKAGGNPSVEDQGPYEHGTEVTVNANPVEGYNFLNWTEDGTKLSTDAEYTFTIEEDRNLTAKFELSVYTLELKFGGGGSGAVNMDGKEYTEGTIEKFDPGTDVTLSADPGENSLFIEWTINDTAEATSSTTLKMDSDKTVTAIFEPKEGTPAKFRVDKQGNVYSDGKFYGEDFVSEGGDLAERVEVSQKVEPGDVLALDSENPGNYELAQQPYSAYSAGVVATKPGMTLGTNDTSTQATMALKGIVPVRVTTKNGPIQPGDLLTTSSKPGYAMVCDDKAKCSGAIVGKALGALKEGKGIVKTLIVG